MSQAPGPPDRRWQADPAATLVSTLYAELRKTAVACLRRERPNHTLQPTALVNETYLRLCSQGAVAPKERSDFLAVSAHLMREILVDYARTRNRAKRGGGVAPVALEDIPAPFVQPEVDLIALDDALDRLESLDPQHRQIVELRYFAGLSIEETAQVIGVSTATVKRDWRAVRAWLHRELSVEANREP